MTKISTGAPRINVTQVSPAMKEELETAFRCFSSALFSLGITIHDWGYPKTLIVERSDLSRLYSSTRLRIPQLIDVSTAKRVPFPADPELATCTEKASYKKHHHQDVDSRTERLELSEEELQEEMHDKYYEEYRDECDEYWNSRLTVPGKGQVRVTADEILLPATKVLGKVIRKVGGLESTSIDQLASEDLISEFFESLRFSVRRRYAWIFRALSRIEEALVLIKAIEPNQSAIDYAIVLVVDARKDGSPVFQIRTKSGDHTTLEFRANDKNKMMLLYLMFDANQNPSYRNVNTGQRYIPKFRVCEELSKRPRLQDKDPSDAAKRAVSELNKKMANLTGINAPVLEKAGHNYLINCDLQVVQSRKREKAFEE